VEVDIMAIAKGTVKGQILIPIEYRKKYGIETPGQVIVTEREGQLVILPVPQDPISGARGILKPKRPLDIAHKEYKEEELSLEDSDD